jgi:potassium uptake TrkH family protein
VPRRRLLDATTNPAQFVVVAFVALIAVGAVLLALPIAFDSGEHPGSGDALFMSASAATVTGLATVDIETFSLFGELVLLALMQVGGFGIVTIGSVFALLASHRIGLRQRMLTRTELGAVEAGELRALVAAVATITIAVEAVVATVLTLRLWASYDEPIGEALYSGVFHAVASFNNAGLSLYSDNLTRFVGDPVVTITIAASFIIGGFGFPVLVELLRRVRPSRWSLHTRITLLASGVLFVVGPLFVIAVEWSNPATLGQLDVGDKLLAGWFQGLTPRTAGFNTIAIGEMNEGSLLVLSTLMFIGAGSASTSGGIKVTTFAVLGYAIWADIRGERDVIAFRRRIPTATIRQALTVALLSVGLVVGTSLLLELIADVALTSALFEAASAFGTVGLSTGITPALPFAGKLLIVVVMLAGRVGPVTFVAAIALRERLRTYRYPEERPIIG